MKQPETFADITAEYARLADRHLAKLRERMDVLVETKARIEEEMLVLADDIENFGTHPTKRQRRSRYDVPECGTESGYQRHRHRGEACEDCRAAHRDHERIRAARRKLVKIAQSRSVA